MSTDPDRTQSEQTDHDDSGAPAHAAPEGAERHPLIDLSRDPHPGVADHAKPDED
ncbi:hypothetical protein A8924_3558 [Saccharopolyspora erythraea NRRL 2338]|uniref:Uncharacterized protein n=2 Tax=Saccharopolyspora erythraea TaxID=1836 RepID=A4FEG8_SACEN|nr:hypothetical protein [Saccharopolyspora erythraea]EQD83670.1 hypothetical protein N599_24010 [Saccharopolyspora erythraea D]PFG96169.1 hypothetical protein A8924_3558 [Saccharopolyspora erythraea NRRL 2338]QRK92702.1 hypothetical protein JQX30_16235 [Saccharopolyspora erythraea]CAM02443.1 hypothetical protein SACE_3167 [Saccharopolyspora erythraea NRRL 2338]